MIKNIIKNIIPGYELSKKIYRKYRISAFFKKKKWKIFANVTSYLLYKKYNCFISNEAKIGKSISFPHPIGIIIGEGVEIGKNVTIYQNVTLGRKNKDIWEYPKIEDDVVIYCNSVILGAITIGKGAIIGAGSIVLRDVKPGETVFGIVK